MRNTVTAALMLPSFFHLVVGTFDEFIDNPHSNTNLKSFHISSLWSMVCQAVLVLVLALLIQICTRHVRASKKKPAEMSQVVQLSMYAHLAAMSYHTTYIKPSRDEFGSESVVPNLSPSLNRVEINDAGNIFVSVPRPQTADFRAEYRIEAVQANNAVWLLRLLPRQRNVSAKWVVLFRGTKTLDDVATDMSLIAAVASDDCAGFARYLDRRASQLRDHLFRGNGVSRVDSIVLVGHSLGGSVAEAMLARLHADGFKNVEAYAFDSPGIPESERSKLPKTPWEKLTIVYARDNVVNNLNPAPSRAHSYLMDTRDPLEISMVSGWMQRLKKSLQDVMTMFSPKSLYEFCLGPHSIERISKGIERGCITQDENVAARQVSGILLRRIYSWFTTVQSGAQRDDNVSMRSKRFGHNINCESSNNRARNLQHPEFPGAQEALREYQQERNKAEDERRNPNVLPYSITDLRKFSDTTSPANDIVIPLVGLTSVGKSSLLKAILELPVDDQTIPVGAKMNVTVTPVVVLWKVGNMGGEQSRIWLMDLPGVRGASNIQNSEESNQFVDVNIPTQLAFLSESVQAACFVCGDNAKEEDKTLFDQTYTALNGRIVVAHNVKGFVAGNKEKEELTDEIREEFGNELDTEDERSNLKVIRVKVARAPGATQRHLDLEEGILDLTDELFKSCELWRDNIKARIGKRRNAAKEEWIAKRAQVLEDVSPFWDGIAIGSAGAGGAVAGAGGAAAALEGIAVGLAVSPVGAPIILSVAPVVGIAAASWAFFRRRAKRKKAAREKAKMEHEEHENAWE